MAGRSRCGGSVETVGGQEYGPGMDEPCGWCDLPVTRRGVRVQSGRRIHVACLPRVIELVQAEVAGRAAELRDSMAEYLR